MKNKKNNILKIFLVIGMLISLFLIYEHFSETASEFCTFGTSFDCGIVNKSPYSTLDGISYLLTIDYGLNLPLINLTPNLFLEFIFSNAFLGFLTLLFLFFLLLNYEKKKGFVRASWCAGRECEDEIKQKTTATVRLIPLQNSEPGQAKCAHCGQPAKTLAYFAKSY